MKTLTEDYVSYETAVLLKEKGFVGEGEIGCRCGFYEQNKEYPSQINLVHDDLDNSELERNECLRFTHQMTLKWLREVHNIHIEIRYMPGQFTDEPTYKAMIWDMDTEIGTPLSPDISYTYFETCIEAALKYTLENLI